MWVSCDLNNLMLFQTRRRYMYVKTGKLISVKLMGREDGLKGKLAQATSTV